MSRVCTLQHVRVDKIIETAQQFDEDYHFLLLIASGLNASEFLWICWQNRWSSSVTQTTRQWSLNFITLNPSKPLLLQTTRRWETLWWSRCCVTASSTSRGKNKNLSSESPSPSALPSRHRAAALCTSFKDKDHFCSGSERFPSDGRQDGVDEVEESRHVREDLKRQREHQWKIRSSEDHEHPQDHP